MSFSFTAENQKAFETLLTRYPNKQAALLPTLWLAQNQHGFLPLEVQKSIAQMLDLSPAHVFGVVSFYTMFKDKPQGQYHLQLCRTLSCALCGAEGLIDHVQKRLGIQPGETTKDGKFSLELVECLASCGSAPAMAINETYAENLTLDKVNQLIDQLQKE